MMRSVLGISASLFALVFYQPSFSSEEPAIPIIDLMVENIQQKHPDFRIVKTIEDYPERYNANIPIDITTIRSDGREDIRALITLHDGKTGAPVESCYAPCVLHKSYGQPALASVYKDGYFSLPREIEDRDVLLEHSGFWDDKYKISLGLNYKFAQYQKYLCAKKFGNLPKDDKDTTPCYRIPPMIPQVDFSGYCRVAFDISKEGSTKNFRIKECSDPAFEIPSQLTVILWAYHPKVERGEAVERPGVDTKLIYEVTDYDGHLLDEKGERVEEEAE